MQKRHVTQKARCVRLVHGDHISRLLWGKTQGIVGPRARTKARMHAHVCTILWHRRGSWWRFQEWLMPGRRRAIGGWRLAERQSSLLATKQLEMLLLRDLFPPSHHFKPLFATFLCCFNYFNEIWILRSDKSHKILSYISLVKQRENSIEKYKYCHSSPSVITLIFFFSNNVILFIQISV